MSLKLILAVIAERRAECEKLGLVYSASMAYADRQFAQGILEDCGVDCRKHRGQNKRNKYADNSGNPRRILAIMTRPQSAGGESNTTILMGAHNSGNGNSNNGASLATLESLRAAYERLEPLGQSPFDKPTAPPELVPMIDSPHFALVCAANSASKKA